MKQEPKLFSKILESTLILKLTVIVFGMPVLALAIYGLTWLPNNPPNPEYAHALYPIVAGMYASTIPFFFALYQALKLLSYIDKSKAFSDLSVKALKNIKLSAFAISTIYTVVLPFVFILAEKDDAPGAVLFGMLPIFASVAIAIFAAVLQKLLKEAIDIKSENDLTV